MIPAGGMNIKAKHQPQPVLRYAVCKEEKGPEE